MHQNNLRKVQQTDVFGLRKACRTCASGRSARGTLPVQRRQERVDYVVVVEWQTRKLEVLVPKGVRVRLPPTTQCYCDGTGIRSRLRT